VYVLRLQIGPEETLDPLLRTVPGLNPAVRRVERDELPAVSDYDQPGSADRRQDLEAHAIGRSERDREAEPVRFPRRFAAPFVENPDSVDRLFRLLGRPGPAGRAGAEQGGRDQGCRKKS
jgi:hypothetical protein